MSILTRWLLIPPVNARLIGRYRDYRRHVRVRWTRSVISFKHAGY